MNLKCLKLELNMVVLLLVDSSYLPAFVIVGKVAVSGEASCTELLPGVGVLIGLQKCQNKFV